MVEGGDYCCQRSFSSDQNWRVHFAGKCPQNEEDFWTLWIWKKLRIRLSAQEHLYCGILAKVKQMSGDLFSDNSYLSALLDRQGLLVAAPVDLHN